MALHFSIEEYESRRRETCRLLDERALDGLLMFRQESMYYLTGYDTAGYVMFQGLYLSADGKLALLTRSADRIQAAMTSIVKDVRIWKDEAGARPAIDLKMLVADLGGAGKRIGIEYEAYSLTGTHCKALEQAFNGFAQLEDASDIVRTQRLTKSAAELDYVRKAGSLSDQALDIATHDCLPGATVGAIYGDMLRVIMAGGGDPSAGNWPLGAGKEALLVRYHTGIGHGRVSGQDQMTFEFAAAYRHYHAALMTVVLTGKPDPRQVRMYEACREALKAVQETLKPGNTVGDLFDAHARTFDGAGYAHAYLNACGYTMNANYAPNWMDTPMIFAGNAQVLAPGMVFFTHMILLDDRTGLSMSLGETAIVTEDLCEPVNHAPRELVVN